MVPDSQQERVTRVSLAGIVGRLNARLMPFLLLMYVLAFIDRTNIGFAKEAFQAQTGISNAAYALGASIFFTGYAFLEVPSNLLLQRFGGRIWLARIMVSWGLVSAAMFLARGEKSFYLLRFLLGIAEAGFFPGVVFYLTKFYPEQYRARAMGLFYVGAPLSFILGGPISGALLKLDGQLGLAGWQWLFLVEGLLASLVGVLAFIHLPDGPEQARWLTAAQKLTLQAQLEQEHGTPHHIGLMRALRSGPVLYLGTIYLLIQMSVYGLVFFLPSQIAAIIGRSVGWEVGVLSVVPWTAALIATLIFPWLADRTGRHALIAALIFTAAGVGLAGSAWASGPVLLMASLSLAAASFIAVQPVFWALASKHLPKAQAAGAIALINALGAAGSFLAPNVRVAIEGALHSATAGILALALLCFLGAAMLFAWTSRPQPQWIA
ncbi:MFS transporter [Novosphingobium rosa]|uniref:MFS transporter n=1 Tax=Novosphingobium rosa TaxID=76978 RepID=UPI0008351B7C|nr:MFS transporter [Novosphingobium rosa]